MTLTGSIQRRCQHTKPRYPILTLCSTSITFQIPPDYALVDDHHQQERGRRRSGGSHLPLYLREKRHVLRVDDHRLDIHVATELPHHYSTIIHECFYPPQPKPLPRRPASSQGYR